MAVSETQRDLAWEGCYNVRDLGGLPTREGGPTRFGAVVRSDNPGRLTANGIAAMRDHGVRSVVDLRDSPELADDRPQLESDLDVVNIPVLDFGDADFWEPWRGVHDTPRFYREALARWQERFARAVSAVARARAGGVLVHCEAGRDRTGLVCALLLSVAGVPTDSIAADYALSAERLRPLYEQWLAGALSDEERERLSRENVSKAEAIEDVLGAVDVRAYLLKGGATADDLRAIEERLTGAGPATASTPRRRPSG